MSISGIIYAGQSGLISAQTQISVTSTNIANANTEGYTAKRADTATTVNGGQATGVAVIGVGNDIDKALMADVMSVTSEAAYDATMSAYLESVLSSLGTTADGSDLEAATTDLMIALSDAINAGGDAASQDAVETALATWAATLNATSAATQSARTAADQGIAEAVEEVNALLVDLDDLNRQIARANAAGQSTADLEDAQRVALEQLSEYLDIGYYKAGTGELHVYSAGGEPLLTSSPHKLSYVPYGPMGADAEHDAGSDTGIGGIVINGEDATAKLTGGEIGALITLRDEELPALQDELDALAIGVMDALNAAANSASPAPPPQSLTSAGTVDPTAVFNGTGTVTVLETDADGTVTGSTDIDLSTMTTYQDLIDALDAVPGISATLDGDGKLVVSADTAGHGVILTGDGAVDADNKGLSHHLGFNDVLSGTGASDITVAATLEDQGPPIAAPASTTVGDTALAAGDTGGLEALWTALDSPITFDAAGYLTAMETSAVAQISTIVDDFADRTETAGERAERSAGMKEALAATFDNAHGVNVDEEMARLTALEQSYQASSQILATAQDMFDSLLAMMR